MKSGQTKKSFEADMRNKSGPIVLAMGVFAIAACTNLDGSSNRTGTGGLIGAGAGALIGRAIDDGGTSGTIVGGAIGSIAGAALGGMLDRQHRELQEGLAGSGATVVNTGEALVVTLPEAITFDVDSATVHPDYVDEIAFVAGNLRGNANSTVQVIGHTDDTGSTAHNQGLSERRADAVATILTANGVEAWRVSPSGVGYARPVASNDTPGGRAQNRRVEIVITPTGTAA
jgi:outer membrane protein OmpA-like peptidoglycan-associated protein